MPSISIGLALAFSSFALGTTTQATPAPAPKPIPVQAQTVQETVATYFADIPIMVAISSCESHYRQYDVSGAVYRGEQNHQDVGVMQINEHYHLDISKKLGYDIYTTEGNMAYARFLYEQNGVAPWMSSSPCWQRSVAAHNLENARAQQQATKDSKTLATTAK